MAIFVITGGAGFIGSHLAERLLKEGHTVRIIDNLLTGKSENIALLSAINGDLHIHTVSITDFKAIRPVFIGADYVLHYAAVVSVPYSVAHPRETHDVNVTGMLNVLIASHEAGVKRVIFASSSAVYGNDTRTIQAEAGVFEPISPYGVSKWIGEIYMGAFYRQYGLETVCFRYFNVFGSRQDPASQYAAVIPKFIAKMKAGESPTIFGTGEATRDFTHIDTVVQANLLATTAPNVVGKVMNIATGTRVSVNDLVNTLNRILGKNITPIYAPARAGDILHSCADIELARTTLGFEPLLDFEAGLRKTIGAF
ncbi:MAG TPA: NAD-dependent epimerase/dehydratase family protein [Aggregatilineales bacterium]|nr:NAD-dependent epimerase/dehydratase family protein [Aggregatilineales bacterium]